MRKITILLAALIITTAAWAILPPQMSGIYKVGTGETSPNFALLSEAVTAINNNGLNGDVVLEITSDITETVNIGLIQASDYTLTIRPDQDVDRTITFNKASDNAGPSGAFCMGIGMGLSWNELYPTKNVIINGFAEGGSTMRLKIATAATHSGYNNPILLMDDCSNIQIKNCIIHHIGSSTGSSNYGIYLRVDGRYGTKKMPSNVLIENNSITCMQNTASQGIGIYSSVVPTSLATGIIIKNNVINARTRGVFLYYAEDINIVENEFHIKQTANGVLSSALFGGAGLVGNINVFDNKFLEMETANTSEGAYGMRGILASGGGTWNIQNNYFTGFDKTTSTAGETMLQAIRCGSTCFIQHNTFYLNELTNKPTYVETPTDAQGSYCAINIAAGTPTINNNIFIGNEDVVTNFAIRGTVAAGYSDYNVFYARPEVNKSSVNSVYPEYSEYVATGVDTNSKMSDVEFVDAEAGNLDLTGVSVNDLNLAVPQLSDVLTDIAGTSRGILTYVGAHEASDLSAIAKQFTVTVPNGTENVYIAGGFINKDWDVIDPLKLTATNNENEFSAILACVDGVEYKYLCEKGDWDYAEATFNGGNDPLRGENRTYNAADVVPVWYRVKSVQLNVSFAEGSVIPAQLFVKGSFNSWASPIELTKVENSFNTIISGVLEDKIPGNTQYKYCINDGTTDNWESDASGNVISNRWSVAPVMNDVIARFETMLTTNVNEIQINVRIRRTYSGVEVVVDGESTIEIYSMNGVLIDNQRTNGTYSRDLNNGVYIIRINGKATKFIK